MKWILKVIFLIPNFILSWFFYVLLVVNLLAAQRIAEDQYMGINDGKSLHQGIE